MPQFTAKDISSTAIDLGINYLLHFTQADNLVSIFQDGILPVTEIRRRGISAHINDLNRLDYCLDATSTSIHYPNHKLFYKFKSNSQKDWVMLGLSRELIWEKKCAFCAENAASSSVTRIPLESRMDVNALKRMYEEVEGKPPRSLLGIDKSLPTNPQAEILVFGIIEPKYIWGIAFENQAQKNKYQSYVPSNVKIEVAEHLFKYTCRIDYSYW